MPQQPQQPPMAHMLAEGQYGVIVNVGKSQQTLKAETFAGMNALAQAAPTAFKAIGAAGIALHIEA